MAEIYFRLPFWCRLVWLLLILGVLGRVAIAKPTSASVVPIYLNAGQRWIQGENIYSPAPPLDVYRNPPPVAAFFALWSQLPDKPAAILWRLLGIGVYLAAIVRLVRHFESSGTAHPQSSNLFVCFSGLLVVPSFNNGQVNVLLIGLLLHAWLQLDAGRLWLAAGAIAVVTVMKIYPISVGLLCCVVVPRLATRLAVVCGGIVLLSLCCHKPGYCWSMYHEYCSFLELESRHRLVFSRVQWDWTMILDCWGGCKIEDSTRKVVSVSVGLLIAMMILLTRKQAQSLLASLSLGCAWMTLFGPASEHPTYTLLAPIAAMQFFLARSRFDLGIAWLICLLLSLPILRGMFPNPNDGMLTFRTADPLAALVLIIAVIKSLVDNRSVSDQVVASKIRRNSAGVR